MSHSLRLPLLGLLLAPLASQLACSGQDFQVTGIVARMVASPSLTDFGTLPVGASAQDVVTLSAAKGSIDIVAVEVIGNEGSTFSWVETTVPTVTEDEPVDLVFTYAPQEAGFHWAEVHIYTDEAEDDEHIVDLRGVAADGLVAAWPSIVDFGPVATGDSASAQVTLSNEGDLDLVVQDVAMSGANPGNFSADDLPLTLDAGQQQILTLVFSPTDQNAARADATLDFDGLATLAPLTLRGNDCETATSTLYDQDGDGVSWCANDCDDNDASSHPGAAEVCDGADNDCDGVIDEGTSCYDDDGDGYSEDDGDCHDGDDDIGPGAGEVDANGIDDDCDGVIDDGARDTDGDGFADTAGDCDDSEPDANPGEIEVSDGIDNDCDGLIDEGTASYDDDGDGYSEDDGDCDDSDDDVNPDAAERANWLDDDCDGSVDEGTDNADDDGDGFSEIGGDCDDSDDEVNPGEPEVIGDSIDNNCDGRVQ